MAYVARSRTEGASEKGARDPLVVEATEMAEEAYLWDETNRQEAIRDLEMVSGSQWETADRKARDDKQRPVLTINRLLQPVKQVANDIRQAVPSVRVTPIDKHADGKVADIYGGLFRSIQRRSNASWVYAMAGGHAAACGIGHFRITTFYADDSTFDQEIGVDLIPFPLSVLWQAGAIKPDRSDAQRCLVVEAYAKSAYQKKFGKSAPNSFALPEQLLRNHFTWFTPDHVMVAEYWRVEKEEKEIGLLADGSIVDMTNVKAINAQVLRTRKVEGRCVYHTLMNGIETLSDDTKWAGRWIPIVPVVGNEIPLEMQVVRHGVIRFSRDAQKMYNYQRSNSAEWLAQAPKAPYLMTPEELEGFKEMWDTANTEPRPYLLYNRDPQNPQAKPYREAPPTPPAALWEEARINVDEIKATSGIHDAGLGAKSNEVSGRAIMARQREGDIANFEIGDNLKISLNHAGKVMMDLAPSIYDTERIVRILDEEEKEHFVPINHLAYTQDGRQVLVHDLTVGAYDLALSIGPSATTRRAEASEALVELAKNDPRIMEVGADIVVEGMDVPGAERLAKRLKRIIPEEILGEAHDVPKPPPDPLMVEGVKQEVREKKASADKKEAEAHMKIAQSRLADAQAHKELRSAVKATADAGLSASKAMRERVGAQVDVLDSMKPDKPSNGATK